MAAYPRYPEARRVFAIEGETPMTEIPDMLANVQQDVRLVRAAVANPTRLEAALVGVQDMREQLVAIERALVEAGRAEGMSWPQIGKALGITHQGAMRRYSDL